MRGAASGNDFLAPESGTLTWNDGDGEALESLFIRLENALP